VNAHVRYTRRSGMRFLRIGRLQFSFCLCRAPLPRQPAPDVLYLRRAWLVQE
jgi:hypothetical protein